MKIPYIYCNVCSYCGIVFIANCVNKTAAHNSKRGIDVVLRGITRDFVEIAIHYCTKIL